MESLLANLARKQRDRLRVSRVDIEEHPELGERLGVTEVPTLVLVADQKVLARLEGRSSAPRIERMIGRHLDPSNGAIQA
jgi:thioredoxin-like negative regulator of GroEL